MDLVAIAMMAGATGTTTVRVTGIGIGIGVRGSRRPGGRRLYRPNAARFKTFNGCQNGYTVQDGLCKPYRGY